MWIIFFEFLNALHKKKIIAISEFLKKETQYSPADLSTRKPCKEEELRGRRQRRRNQYAHICKLSLKHVHAPSFSISLYEKLWNTKPFCHDHPG